VLQWLPRIAALQVQFLAYHRQLGNFKRPLTFSEKLQWRKLYSDDTRFVEWSDKVRVKSIVADRLGSEWTIPTLWEGTKLPPREVRDWPIPFVIKANHASGRNYFVRQMADLAWDQIEDLTRQWMQTDWPAHLYEGYYNKIVRRILVEPIIGDSDLMDYKFFCFSGRVQCIQVDVGRFTAHTRCFYSRDWNKRHFSLKFPFEEKAIEPPRHLDKMIWAAERLSSDFDFVRIDLYDTETGPLFGESTFIPGSGFELFSDPSIERELGDFWRITDART
jgi:hypothetical protein